jgi:putative SOS response-associated peptidase YedK
MITTAASPLMAPIHGRMSALLRPEASVKPMD